MMSERGWPTPERPAHAPLPRVEDLPVAEQGYDRDSVRAAFEAFYRHAAQLDATLRTLEAVELFQRQAEELRTDLRAIRSSSWAEPPQWTPTYDYRFGAVERAGIPPAVWRYAAEVAFLVGVAVALGVAQVRAWVIVAVMAAAWVIVGAAEWVAGRERAWAGRTAPQPVVDQPAAPPAVATPQLPADTEEVGWAAFEEAQEPSDAMTMVGSLPDEDEAEPEAEASEPEPVAEAVAAEEPEPETEPPPLEDLEQPQVEAAEPHAEAEEEPPAESPGATEAESVAEAEPAAADEPAPRRRWWRRHAETEAEPAAKAPEPPRHVRVLPHEPAAETPGTWERRFDADGDSPAPRDEAVGAEEEPEAGTGDAVPDESEADSGDAEPDALAPVEPVRPQRRRRK